MDSGDDPEGFSCQRKKRFHRHTPMQIQTLESVFRECPHPDEKQRMRLSRELSLQPRQIKFWFQNRRTQMKAQNERADNSSLRSENERIRWENISMKEALGRVICPNCGGPPYLDEEKLRFENARLKDELDRMKMGTSINRILPMASLSLSVGISEDQTSLMVDEASAAMEELIRLAHAEEPLWKKSENGRGETLDLENYSTVFSRVRDPNLREEGTRATCEAMTAAEFLVEALMDTDKWMELFPEIISQARTIEVLSNGVGGRNGSLALMYAEEQFLSPVISPREFFFLRYCRQIDHRTWAIADVSRASPFSLPPAHRKLPSGCIIQDAFNGFSKVTWVEHLEIEDRIPILPLCKNLIINGVAFGAHRWSSTLRRACERSAFSFLRHGHSATMSWEGKKSMMKLSQRMVSCFCKSIFPLDEQRWSTTYHGGVRIAMYGNRADSVVLSAATSVHLPSSPDTVFTFLKNEFNRPQWDVLSSGNSVEEIARISTGEDAGNCISLLRSLNGGENSMLILQESCTSLSRSMVVYAPVDMSGINAVMNGQDEARVPLLPSGFAIVGEGGGALVTVAFQILVSGLPSARMNVESVATVNSLISTTVSQIKTALNTHSMGAPAH